MIATFLRSFGYLLSSESSQYHLLKYLIDMFWNSKLFVHTLPATVLCLVLLQTSAFAAESEYMDRPLLVVAVAGIERFEEDLKHLSELSGFSESVTKYQELKQKFSKLPGIDESRPIGGAIVLHREQIEVPAAIVFLPVTDGTLLVEELQKMLPAIQDVSDGRWLVKFPNVQLHVILQNDYLLISQKEEVLPLATPERLAHIQSLTSSDDLYAHLDLAGLSDPVREKILTEINDDLSKDADRKQNESDDEFRLRNQLLQLIKIAIAQFIADSESFTAGIQIESEIAAHLQWTAKSASVLAAQFNRLSLDKKQVSLPANKDVPIQAQFGINLPKGLQLFLLDAFHVVQEHIRKEIGPKLAAADRGPASGAFDSIEQTIQRGHLDGVVSFQESDSHEMILAAGLKVVEEDLLANFLNTILPYAHDSDDIREVEMNIIESDLLNLHRLQGREQRDDDRRLYGNAAALYVGTSSETFWIANGNKQTPALLEGFAQRPTQTAPPLLTVEFSLDPWLRLSEKHQHDIKKIQIVRRAIPDEQHDQITFELKNIPNGLKATLNAEKGYFKLFGIALKEEQIRKRLRQP